ncbi:MAG: alpha-galactosidase [Parabacteroides sp.]|nr:alpha-galactosidase [Parabacteroides sp.]
MKNNRSAIKSLFLCVSALTVSGAVLSGCVERTTLNAGEWSLAYDARTNGIDITKGSKLIYDNVYVSYTLSDSLVSSRNYTKHTVSTEKIKDDFGEGYLYEVTYIGDKLPLLVQSFYIYPEKEYVLTDFTLEDASGIATNYMAPVNVDRMPEVLGEGENNRALFIPFDNDCWIRYQSHPLTFTDLTSYEVTAVFNNASREAIVVGSVEHDNWKSAVTMGKGTRYNIGSLVCYGGAADKTTRDSKPHGALKGAKVKSPKVLLGFFEDWREGLEAYARANAVIAPPKPWDKAVPFGWNSWGALQFNLTYTKALEVSDYYKQNLQHNQFVNADKLVYIGLDSGWNSFSEEELKDFVNRCKANGQVAGVYWTPFTDWAKNPEREIKEMPGCRYKDVYLYANGKPQELDGAFAVDPTHPAIEAMMKSISGLFHRAGFEYVKMDFMTHGAMEADRWYNGEIQTGIQGYNYGMKLLDKYFGDMYINLSISPVFPAQYAQSRRIACDAWNKMKDTEYTLNALSYGWWQDRIYQFNDPDHIVLREATDGENRARVTSGVVTGLFIAGDDFSKDGPEEVKNKAMKYMTNSEINAIANGEAFRPVEGDGEKSENRFVRIDKDGKAYYAVFNYTDKELKMTVALERLGLDSAKEYELKELWSGAESSVRTNLEVMVPACDAVIFRME